MQLNLIIQYKYLSHTGIRSHDLSSLLSRYVYHSTISACVDVTCSHIVPLTPCKLSQKDTHSEHTLGM